MKDNFVRVFLYGKEYAVVTPKHSIVKDFDDGEEQPPTDNQAAVTAR